MKLLNKKGLVIRHLPRHDEAVLRRCEAAGVAVSAAAVLAVGAVVVLLRRRK